MQNSNAYNPGFVEALHHLQIEDSQNATRWITAS